MLIRFESAPEPKLRQVLQVRWADDGGWKEGWGRGLAILICWDQEIRNGDTVIQCFFSNICDNECGGH